MVIKNRLRKLIFPEPNMIGRRFKVIDNSYQRCISTGQNHYLAGMLGELGQTVEIMSQPYYKKEVDWQGHLVPFIKGKCKRGLIHEILFFKHGLLD